MTASYIPLLAIQQRSHSRVYAIPALEHVSATDMRAAGQAVRQRLLGKPMLALPKPGKPMHVVPWPDTPPTLPNVPEEPSSAPLDMLGPCSWRFLVKLAALRNGQTTTDILGHSRTVPVVRARHEAIYLVASHTIYSITRIGNKFGRDHTSILHALTKFPPFERERLQAVAYVDPIFSDVTSPERAAIIVRGFADGVPRQEIAEQIGLSLATVKRFAYLHGLRHQTKPRRGHKASGEAQQ